MTREEIRNLVIHNVSRTDKDDLINSLIDLGLIEIAKKHVFGDLKEEFEEAVVADDYSLELPAEGYTLLEARVIDPAVQDDGYPLEVLDKRDFLNFHPNLTNETNGEPCQGYVENGFLFFGPPALAARTIFLTMYKMPVALASDATEIPIRTAETAIISWVTSMVFMALEQFDSASFWTQRHISVDLPGLIDADRRKAAEMRVRRGYREVPVTAGVSHFRRMSAFYNNGQDTRW